MSLIKTSELTGLLDKVLKETGRLRTGSNLQYHCPFCHHRKRKLEVCLDGGFWHCWTCDAKGRNYFTLFRKLKVGPADFSALEKIVGTKPHVDKETFFDKPLISFKPPTKEINKDTLELPENFISLTIRDSSIEYRRAINYARKRKITGADIVKYNIGYCAKGRYENRLVFPSYDKDNHLNFFSTRSYFDDTFLKYINSEVSKDIIGFENLVDFDYPIYLCEGALDAISVRRNAIPLFGKTLSEKLKTALIESRCPEVNIVLDDDAIKSALRIADFVKSIGKVPKLVELKGKDPSVLGFEKTTNQVRGTDVLDFKAEMRIRLGI